MCLLPQASEVFLQVLCVRFSAEAFDGSGVLCSGRYGSVRILPHPLWPGLFVKDAAYFTLHQKYIDVWMHVWGVGSTDQWVCFCARAVPQLRALYQGYCACCTSFIIQECFSSLGLFLFLQETEVCPFKICENLS